RPCTRIGAGPLPDRAGGRERPTDARLQPPFAGPGKPPRIHSCDARLTVTLNYRHFLLGLALFMGSLAVVMTFQGYLEHSPLTVGFEFAAAVLMICLAAI